MGDHPEACGNRHPRRRGLPVPARLLGPTPVLAGRLSLDHRGTAQRLCPRLHRPAAPPAAPLAVFLPVPGRRPGGAASCCMSQGISGALRGASGSEAAALRRPPVRLPPTSDILAGLAVFGLVVVPLLVLKFHGGKFPLDLAVYREAGRVVLHGGDPYAPDFGRHLRIPLPFTYPPFAAVGSVVLGVLPEPVAIVAWTTLSLSLLVVMVWLVLGQSLRHPVLLGLAAGALAWTVPLNETISFGQVNL
ncbi:MAG: DUF2029 domain-containing protein, partial [Actinobacteria bacterium]